MQVILPLSGVNHGSRLIEFGPLHHDRVVAECAHKCRPVLSQRLRLVLRLVVLHEGKERRGFVASRLGIKHPREAQLAVEPAEKAVEGRRVTRLVDIR